MIYTITLNPALDKTVVIPSFAVDKVNRVTQVRVDPGGKGINVSKMIENLGGTSVAYAALGGEAGRQWQNLVQGFRFPVSRVQAHGETRTNLKVVDPHLHTNTDINEPGAALSKSALESLNEKLKGQLQPGDILVLSGSVPFGVDKDIYGKLTALAHTRGARTIVDAEGPLLTEALKARPYLVKPNQYELGTYVGRPLSGVEDIAAAAEQMLQDGAQMVLVSMGADGALLFHHGVDGGSRQFRAAAPSVCVSSTVGAGDSMVGAFAYGLEQGMPVEKVLRLAVAAGTAAVTCDGSQAPTLEQIERIKEQICVVS
ncbi:MAG: 1-phosphofructokinase [Lachnospiraceae bacterium]|nr:1-phosphofructokinase [Lachnospiraceae bacterium]